MIIKKIFTDWKKAYRKFLICLVLFELLPVLLVYNSGNSLDGFDIFGLSLLFVLFHIVFVVMQFAKDVDRYRESLLTLAQFTQKYKVSEERALWLLKEGKISGTLSFEDTIPPKQSKVTVKEFIKATE